MTMMSFFVEMLVVGCVAGVMNGALGIGGGIVMIPAMHQFVPGMDAHTAKGTSLFVITFVSAVNAWRQNRPIREIPWRTILLAGLGAIAGSYAGAHIAGALAAGTVMWIFTAVVSIIFVRLLLTEEPAERNPAYGWRRAGAGLAAGIVTGCVGGMTGVGGGLVFVPIALLTGLSTHSRVTGMSNMVMVLTCLVAAVVQLRAERCFDMPGTVGQVNLIVAGALLGGAQLGSPLGRWLNRRLTYRRRTQALACLLLLVIARMAYQAFHS